MPILLAADVMNQTGVYKQMTDGEKGQIIAARLQGMTEREIAEQVGRSKSTVHRTLNDDEIRALIEEERRALASYATEAREKLIDKMKGAKDEKLQVDCAKEVLRSTGILATHTPSPLILNLYQDNRSVESHVWNLIGDRLTDALAPPDDEMPTLDDGQTVDVLPEQDVS